MQTATERIHIQLIITSRQGTHIARQNASAVFNVCKCRSCPRHGNGDRLGQSLRLHQSLTCRCQLLVGVVGISQHPDGTTHQHQRRATQQGKQSALMLGGCGRSQNGQANQLSFAIGFFNAKDGWCTLHTVERSVIHILHDGITHHAGLTADSGRNGLASEQLVYFLCKGHSAVSRNLKHECLKTWPFETGAATSAPANGDHSHQYERHRKNWGNALAQAQSW